MPEVTWVHEKFLRDEPEGPRTLTVGEPGKLTPPLSSGIRG